jgi:hypothetical protein
MSQGPGTIEKRIAALFAAAEDRGLSVADIAEAIEAAETRGWAQGWKAGLS